MAGPLLPIAFGASALYSAYKGARNQGKANKLNDEALQLARADYEDRAPLRQAFTQGALTPIAQAPDLSGMFAPARSDNPFATGGAPRSGHVPSQLGPALKMGSAAIQSPEQRRQAELDRVIASLPRGIRDKFRVRAANQESSETILAAKGGPRGRGENWSAYLKRVRG